MKKIILGVLLFLFSFSLFAENTYQLGVLFSNHNEYENYDGHSLDYKNFLLWGGQFKYIVSQKIFRNTFLFNTLFSQKQENHPNLFKIKALDDVDFLVFEDYKEIFRLYLGSSIRVNDFSLYSEVSSKDKSSIKHNFVGFDIGFHNTYDFYLSDVVRLLQFDLSLPLLGFSNIFLLDSEDYSNNLQFFYIGKFWEMNLGINLRFYVSDSLFFTLSDYFDIRQNFSNNKTDVTRLSNVLGFSIGVSA